MKVKIAANVILLSGLFMSIGCKRNFNEASNVQGPGAETPEATAAEVSFEKEFVRAFPRIKTAAYKNSGSYFLPETKEMWTGKDLATPTEMNKKLSALTSMGDAKVKGSTSTSARVGPVLDRLKTFFPETPIQKELNSKSKLGAVLEFRLDTLVADMQPKNNLILWDSKPIYLPGMQKILVATQSGFLVIDIPQTKQTFADYAKLQASLEPNKPQPSDKPEAQKNLVQATKSFVSMLKNSLASLSGKDQIVSGTAEKTAEYKDRPVTMATKNTLEKLENQLTDLERYIDQQIKLKNTAPLSAKQLQALDSHVRANIDAVTTQVNASLKQIQVENVQKLDKEVKGFAEMFNLNNRIQELKERVSKMEK